MGDLRWAQYLFQPQASCPPLLPCPPAAQRIRPSRQALRVQCSVSLLGPPASDTNGSSRDAQVGAGSRQRRGLSVRRPGQLTSIVAHGVAMD